eukprot:m.58943 g.58943  ORF g.58943 m.58943 type:complete len:604 (+) comp11736_c0_seq4:697-2508(+)
MLASCSDAVDFPRDGMAALADTHAPPGVSWMFNFGAEETQGPTCPSCGSTNTCVFALKALRLHYMDYAHLIERGWKRIGNFLYKPNNAMTCCAKFAARFNPRDFVPSHRDREVMSQANHFLALGTSAPSPPRAHSRQSMLFASSTGDGFTPSVGGEGEGYVPATPPMDQHQHARKGVFGVSPAGVSSTSGSSTTTRFDALLPPPRPSAHRFPHSAPATAGSRRFHFSTQQPDRAQHQQSRRHTDQEGAGMSSAQLHTLLEDDMPGFGFHNPFASQQHQYQHTSSTMTSVMSHSGGTSMDTSSIPAAAMHPRARDEDMHHSLSFLCHEAIPHILTQNQQSVESHTLELRLLPADSADSDTSLLYIKAQTQLHGRAPESVTEEEYETRIMTSPISPATEAGAPFCGFGTFHATYKLDGRLVAVSVLDIVPGAVVQTAFYSDPTVTEINLVSYAILREIEFTSQLEPFSESQPYLYYPSDWVVPRTGHMVNLLENASSQILCPYSLHWSVGVSVLGVLTPHTIALSSEAQCGMLWDVSGSLGVDDSQFEAVHVMDESADGQVHTICDWFQNPSVHPATVQHVHRCVNQLGSAVAANCTLVLDSASH